MAEAHQAVSYSELIKQEHTDANHDKEVLALVWKSGVRSWKKRIGQFVNRVRNGVYPAHLESLFIIIGAVMALHFANQKTPFDLVNKISPLMPESTAGWQTVTCCLVGFIYWFSVCLIMRYTLKFLLSYKGFLFETRGKKVSLTTKIWAVLVKVFVKWNSPKIYSFQGSLPRLPLPDLSDTIRRYLRSVRPLLDDASYENVIRQADEFKEGIGKKLQRYLLLKSWWSTNYVSDWWEEYVYLRGRTSLMINSNYYGADYFGAPTTNQTARAASMIYQLLQFRRKLERQEIPPIMAQGFVPLCSAQYERIFNTARIPGVETDKIVHLEDSKHVAVLCKGVYYKVPIYHRGRLLNAAEIQYQLDKIVKANEKGSVGETNLAALTSWNRTKWAQTRDKFFSKGTNKASLQIVESAAFFVVLEDEYYEFDIDAVSDKWDFYCRRSLHGAVNDRWFDKSFNICLGKNARYSVNTEHSWADGPVMGHMIENMCHEDIQSFDKQGNLLVKREMQPPEPIRLSWDINDELLNLINEAYHDGLKLTQDVDHKIIKHGAFGKGEIKKCKVSPDAFIQMALQLAYYRDAGKFCLTYEASMTRLYREGRTETVRSCTIESSAWVKAMDNPNSNDQERVRLFEEACARHQKGYLNAMCGKGIDRHLFCLYVVSKYLEVDSPFLKQAVGEPWRLSTSQTPHGQTSLIDLKKNPGLITPGGGFGPVSNDGYSVSYILSGEDFIFLHLSSIKSCEQTDTTRFGERIFTALSDIRKLCDVKNGKNSK